MRQQQNSFFVDLHLSHPHKEQAKSIIFLIPRESHFPWPETMNSSILTEQPSSIAEEKQV